MMELPKKKGRECDGRRRHYQSIQNHDGQRENRAHEEGLMLSVLKRRASQSRLPREERKSRGPTINGCHPRSDPCYPEENDGKRTYNPHPKSHGLVKRR